MEYYQWILRDTLKEIVTCVGIYAVALGAYWTLVG
jgi:hypothetical protein